MSKNFKIFIVIIIAGLLLLCIVKGTGSGNSPKSIVTDYINALSARDNDKLYEISGIKNLDGDTTFLSKDAFVQCLDPIYESYYTEFLFKNEIDYLNYMTSSSSSKENNSYEEPFGDFKIQEIEYTDGKKAASVEVYFLKYDTTKKVYVKKMKNKWLIEEISDFVTYDDYEVEIPKGLKLLKFAGVNVDDKYIVSNDGKTNTYRFPKIFGQACDAEFEFWDGIKYNGKLGMDSSGNLMKKPYFSLDGIEEQGVYKIKDKVVNDLKVLTEGIFDNKDFSSISNNFSKDDDLSSLEKLYNEEKKWYTENNKHRYDINYDSENDFINYVYIDEDTNNLVVVFLMDFQPSDGYRSYQCRYAFVYNPETGKLIDLTENSWKIMPTANRNLFNHSWMD